MATDVPDLLNGLQERLEVNLRTSRETLDHPVMKGDAVEDSWSRLLRGHLPKRYHVERAQIVDSNGELSDFIDLVIFDRQYTPLIYSQDKQLILPAESVYAVFEVKQELSKENIEYAGGKAASVRKLIRTSTSVIDVGTTKDARDLPGILGGILTTTSAWNPPFGDPFNAVVRGLDKSQRLDFGVAIQNGAFEQAVEGDLNVIEGDNALLHFFFRLMARLKDMGTVPAIDFEAYLKVLHK
jgi:hypothetical protein